MGVLIAHKYSWRATGVGKVRRNNPLQVISGLASFVRQVVVWQRVFNLLREWVHHREQASGELWHVPSGTGVFITFAKFSLMGYSCWMGGKGWWSEKGDTVLKCDFFKCHQGEGVLERMKCVV